MICFTMLSFQSAIGEQISYTFGEGWSMVSFWFATDTMLTDINSYGVDLYEYNSVTKGYDEVTAVGTLARGGAYWAKSSPGGEVTIGADPYGETGDFETALSVGWNMVGNPFSGTLQLSEITVGGVPLSSGGPYSVSHQPPLYYGAGSYRTADGPLRGGEGFWIYADSGVQAVFSAPAGGLNADAGDDSKCIVGVYHTYFWNGSENEYIPVDLDCKLDGTGSSGGACALNTAWEQVSGPSVQVASSTFSVATFVPAGEGPYSFRLTVTDGVSTSTDTVTVNAVRIQGKIVFDSSLEGNHTGAEVYTMNADGTGLSRLTDNSYHDGGAAWSTDGTRLLYTTNPSDDMEMYYAAVMDSDGGNVNVFATRSAGVDWSPDGTKILLLGKFNGFNEIYDANIDGSNMNRLTTNGEDVIFAKYSYDGTKIAFNREYGFDNNEIVVMNSDGGNLIRLTDDTKVHTYLNWTPDGRILYTQADCFICDKTLYIMNDDGSNKRELTLPAGVDDISLFAMTNDGQFIFYKSQDYYLHAMCSDGSCDAKIGHAGSVRDYHPGP